MRLSKLEEIVVSAMARTLFVGAWANKQEERGKTYPGQDIMDIAPKTPKYAREQALRLLGGLEAMNRSNIHPILALAARADGYDSLDVVPDRWFEDFGFCIAMRALGEGVNWFDSHPRFTVDGRELVVPDFEFYLA